MPEPPVCQPNDRIQVIKSGTNGEKAVAQYNAELLVLDRKRAALGCGVQTTLAVIEGHWKLPILFRLLGGTRRFGELRKHLPAATQRMLTLHLRELERDGLIHREVYREVLPKVEYSLTEMGRSLEPLLRFMSEWGHANRALMIAGIEELAGATVDEAPTRDPESTTPVASAVHLR
jgi:DNA-binding HxlR family transcriptional regulator